MGRLGNSPVLRTSVRALVFSSLMLPAAGCDARFANQSCEIGAEERCGNEIGACRQGYRLCTDEGVWTACIGAVEPSAEICDNQDNDCNGVVDDVERPCENDCGEPGTDHCILGEWVCDISTPVESCGDQLDNDCDGIINEGCSCDNATQRDCGTDVGECVPGLQYCRDGYWTLCENAVGPQLEGDTCDNKDNDCDGEVDEGIDCYADCKCPPGETRACADIGVCTGGTQTCVGNSDGTVCNWQPCQWTSGSQPEVCDGLDNNCDGTVDGFSEICQDGECQGRRVCQNGTWGACESSRGPEVCDGRDNDCDGSVDEDLSPQPCNTLCGSGQATCTGGQWLCDAPQGGPETCNGADDDCDGMVDEDLTKSCQVPCPAGGSVAGSQSCTGGTWGACSANQPCPQ